MLSLIATTNGLFCKHPVLLSATLWSKTKEITELHAEVLHSQTASLTLMQLLQPEHCPQKSWTLTLTECLTLQLMMSSWCSWGTLLPLCPHLEWFLLLPPPLIQLAGWSSSQCPCKWKHRYCTCTCRFYKLDSHPWLQYIPWSCTPCT